MKTFFTFKHRSSKQLQIALILMSFAFVFATSCNKKDENKPPSTEDTWSELGSLNANGTIDFLCSDGTNIYAAGRFTNSSGNRYVAKWDGISWSELGSLDANNRIVALCTDAAGNVYAAGDFTNSSNKPYVAVYKK